LCAVIGRNSREVFKVELELHSGWLRKHGIGNIEALSRLPELLPRKELRFVRIDVAALERQLRRRGLPVKETLHRARVLPDGLHAELRRLRQRLGLKNTHRLLIGLKTNQRVEEALRRFAAEWQIKKGAAKNVRRFSRKEKVL
jgi:hypothetical protein